MNSLTRVVSVLLVISLIGCASMFQGPNQNVTLSPINDKAPDQTRCKLKNEEGGWNASPNSAVSIHRDGNTMQINCENVFQTGETNIEPNFSGGYLGLDLLLDLCIVSCVVDGINNAFYDYPPFITVAMKDKGYFSQTKPVSNNSNVNQPHSVKEDFITLYPCPTTNQVSENCPGHVIGHYKLIECGGTESLDNLHWQTVEEARSQLYREGRKCGAKLN